MTFGVVTIGSGHRDDLPFDELDVLVGVFGQIRHFQEVVGGYGLRQEFHWRVVLVVIVADVL